MTTKKQELTRQDDPTGMAGLVGGGDLTQRPDFIPTGDKTGTEGITSKDISLPRLLFAQGLSAQLTPGDAQHIPDLKMFDMFNDLTKQVYGRGPLYFIVCRRDIRRIQFKPREEGGGVLDLNVPEKDERNEWTVDADGHRQPPLATKFVEYVALLLKNPAGDTEPVVLSIKVSNKFATRAAKDLDGYIKMHASKGAQSVPIYGVIYSIESGTGKNDSGTFAIPIIKQVGYLPATEVGKALYDRAADYAASLEGKTVNTNREPGDEDFIDAERTDM